MRNTFPSSIQFVNSNFNANTAYRNYTSQPLNSLVVIQERNQKHQLQQNLQPQSTNSSAKSFNANRSCKQCKSNHSIAACPNTSFVHLVRDTANCLSNKHHKQTCPSNKRCQETGVSIIQHFMNQQNKSNVQQQPFQQKTHKNISLLRALDTNSKKNAADHSMLKKTLS